MTFVDVRKHTETVLVSLDQRLRSAASALLPEALPPLANEPGEDAALLLPQLIDSLGRRAGPDYWLLLTAVGGRFPLATEVEDLARLLELDGREEAMAHLLAAVHIAPEKGRPDLPMVLVTDQVVVDVDYCARHDYNSGIQRVVRHVLPRWRTSHRITPVAHIDQRSGYRTLAPREMQRVFEHGQEIRTDAAELAAYEHRLVVPWRTTVIWSEVMNPYSCRRLAGLAQYSGNTVGLIAYDMIPINSTHLRPAEEAGGFGQYLTAVKHAHRVAGISTSAASEFAGFSAMLPAQGLAGPLVREVELAEEVGPARLPAPPDNPSSRPVVLLPARLEPHKNARAPLHAAQRLWEEGLDFEVRMLSGRGSDRRQVMETVARLKAAEYPVTTLGWVSDEEMWREVDSASFVVFTSLHEGYGLPIAEALACGTPVITTNYGSQNEIAAKGGCLAVDPRSDTELVDAMRTLITDPEKRRALRTEIQQRARRGWDDYANELWSFLVHGQEPAREG